MFTRGKKMILDVIIGSTSDTEKIVPGLEKAVSDIPGLEVMLHYASADNTPEKVEAAAQIAQDRNVTGLQSHVYISGAGMSNVLSGVLKSRSAFQDLNIGIPITDSKTDGISSVMSTTEKPPGNPVLAVGLNNSYAAVNIAHRFLQGSHVMPEYRIVVLGDEVPRTKMVAALDKAGMDYVVNEGLGPNDVVLNAGRDFDRVNTSLDDGLGIQIIVPISDHAQSGLPSLNNTGYVGIQRYENAAQVAAIYTHNMDAIKKIWEGREGKIAGLYNEPALHITKDGTKKANVSYKMEAK